MFKRHIFKRSNGNKDKLETSDQDEDSLFMLSLGGAIKNVSPHRKMATKIKIMSVLDDGTRATPNIGKSTTKKI